MESPNLRRVTGYVIVESPLELLGLPDSPVKVVSMQMAASKVLGNRVGGLQKYAIAFASLTALIPTGVSVEEAATVSITATTSLAAFHALSLPWPTISGCRELDEQVLVWGGGSGVV